MVDIPTFRTSFPEFADTTKYPDSMVALWLTVAIGLVDDVRWGDLYNVAVMLVLAHHLVLASGNASAGTAGISPGVIPSRVASKSVDKVSKSYDTSSGVLDDAGMWGLTTYGSQFYQLSLMFGAGGMQL